MKPDWIVIKILDSIMIFANPKTQLKGDLRSSKGGIIIPPLNEHSESPNMRYRAPF